jgi:hypothetical protein
MHIFCILCLVMTQKSIYQNAVEGKELVVYKYKSN